MPGDCNKLLLILSVLFLFNVSLACYGLGVGMLDGSVPNLRMYVSIIFREL